MVGIGYLLLIAAAQVAPPRPFVLHPEWGPEPPVAPYGRQALPNERILIPMIFPVLGKPRWGNDYGNDRGTHLHTGIDIKAPKMTPIVAPIDGILGLKRNSFWIWNPKGYAVLGTHLNNDTPGTNDNKGNFDYMFAPNLQAGKEVKMGQLIGYVGDSGDATAPHLHFELYANGPGTTMKRIRNPYFSLLNAQVISEPREPAGRIAENIQPGLVRLDGVVRKVDSKSKVLTILLVSRAEKNRRAEYTKKPVYRRISLSKYLPDSFDASVRNRVWSLLVKPPSAAGELPMLEWARYK